MSPTKLALLFSISLPLIFFPSITTHIFFFFLGFVIRDWRLLLLKLKDRVDNSQYDYFIDQFLHAVDSRDIDQSINLLLDLLCYITGTCKYSPVISLDGDFECPITKDTVRNGDKILILPCGHKGSYKEMVEWIYTSHICPLCRQRV